MQPKGSAFSPLLPAERQILHEIPDRMTGHKFYSAFSAFFAPGAFAGSSTAFASTGFSPSFA